MTDKQPPAPLPTPQAILEQRHLLNYQRSERMLIELIRGAFVLNGGALIAVMPVVTAMIGDNAPARLDLRVMVTFFVGGLLAAGFSAFFAYLQADEDVDVSEYRLRKAVLPKKSMAPVRIPLKFATVIVAFLSLTFASAGFFAGAHELAKLTKPAPCPASEPLCNVPELELLRDVLKAVAAPAPEKARADGS